MSKGFGGTVLTGGGTGALDRPELPGGLLVDLNLAFINTAGILYPFWLDDDSAAATDSPNVIPPGTSPGDKRWILQGLRVADLRADNIKIDGNAISSLNTNGDIDLVPNGTGAVDIYSAVAWSEFTRGNLKLSADANPSLRFFDVGANKCCAIEGTGGALRFRVGNTGDVLDDNNAEFFMTNENLGIGVNPITPSLMQGLVLTNGTAAVSALANSVTMWATDIDGAGTSGLVVMGEASITQLRFGDAKILSDSGIIDLGGVGNTNNERMRIDFETVANEVTINSPSGVTNWNFSATLSVLSTDATDKISISHDNTDSYFKTTDGAFVFRTDEGTNTNSYIKVQGKGTGNGHLQMYRSGTTLAWEINADTSFAYLTGYRPLYFQTVANGAIAFMPDGTGNVGIKTTTFDGTAAGNLAIANGTAPGGGTANQSYIYARDVSASSEMHVMDEAGNETQISPHNGGVLDNSDLSESLPFSYSSKNLYLGKEIMIDMTAVIREVEALSGKTFITVEDIPIQDKRDWTANQEIQRLAIQNEIDVAKDRITEIDAMINKADTEEAFIALQQLRDAIVIPDTYIKKQPPKWLKDRGVSLN